MNADLTDRAIKLLYRQRGSRSRQIGHETDDSWPVIQAPGTPEVQSEQFDDDEPLSQPFDEPLNQPFDEPFVEPEQVREPAEEPEQDFPIDVGHNGPVDPVAAVHDDVQEFDDDFSYYNFQNMPLRQLSSSITSITSIDVLISMLTNLFEKDLIPQAIREFESSRDKHSKMMYKLDVRIFESVLEQLVKDFKDILDINMSNNELCYQLKQLVMAREELNEELVRVRRETQELKCGGEWYQLQQEQSDLNNRVKLNEQLNQLNAQLTGKSPIPSQQPPLVTSESINEFCETINPYNGLLTQVDTINERLRHQSFIE